MVVFALVSLATLLLNASLGGYVLARNPGGRAAKAYLLLLLAFVIWDFGEFLVRAWGVSQPPETQRLLINVEWTGIALIASTLPHFILAYGGKEDVLAKRWPLLLLYLPMLAVTVLVWSTDLIVSGVVLAATGPSATVGTWYAPAALIYTAWIFFAWALLLVLSSQATTVVVRRRTRLLFVGLSVPVLVGTITETLWPLLAGNVTRLGMGTVYTVIMGACMAYAIRRYRLLVIEPATEPVAPAGPVLQLPVGHNHLVLERTPRGAYTAFRALATTIPGLVITTTPPRKLRADQGFERTPVLWLTRLSSEELVLRPTDVEFEVYQTAARFIVENKRTVVLVDDLEYLATVNGVDAVMRFTKRLNDLASHHGATTIMSVHPDAFPPQEMALLRATFDEVTTLERPIGRVRREADAILADEAHASAAFMTLAAGGGLLITTRHPLKVLPKMNGHRALWVSEVPATDVATAAPTEADLVGVETIARYTAEVEHPVIMIQGLDYLGREMGWRRAMDLAKSAYDHALGKGGSLVVSLSAEGLSRGERALLEKRFDTVAI